MKGLFLLTIAACGGMLAADAGYVRKIEQMRTQRAAGMKSPGGWLAVTGLVELHKGKNNYGTDPKMEIRVPDGPPHAGSFELNNGVVTQNGKAIQPDDANDVVQVGGVTLMAIKRGDRYFVRTRNPKAAAIKSFSGLNWFPVKSSYWINAQWVSNPTKIKVTNVLGMVEDQDCPGYAYFQLEGKPVRLYPIVEGDRLLFVFKDLTSGKETYGGGRFLDAPLPDAGKVVLDFNMAYNPPCAYTDYATCPLPPKQNAVALRIEAGEKVYQKK